MVKVSVGLPVFNGENFLDEAIRSVLGQTFEDFALVIADNASTDRTGDIIGAAAAADQRVRQLRNPRNCGAAANYNRVWAASRGGYFKWIAHDDRILPTYLAKTLAALETDPAAVLCNTVIRHIDARGEPLGDYVSVLENARRRGRQRVWPRSSCSRIRRSTFSD